jgi:DeoR/GlpR family transcriptional regulator of sugar metabolism
VGYCVNIASGSQSGERRRSRILDHLRQNGYGSQGELARMLGVSEMTVRRDARRLAGEGLVHAVRGGILAIGEPSVGIDFRLREHRHPDTKRAIARAAVDMIHSGATVALDAGTTTLELARLLVPPLQLKVVTSSLPAINVLAGRPDIETIALGGTLSTELQNFTGPLTLTALRRLHVDQVFLAATAISKGAMYCNVMWDAEIKRALIELGDEVVLLADSSKFSMTAIARVASLSAVNTIVVDDLITPAELESIRAAGIRVVTVPAIVEPDETTSELETPAELHMEQVR